MGFSRNTLAFLAAGLLLGVALGVLVILGARLGGPLLANINHSGDDILLEPEIDAPAPDFELVNLAGQPTHLADLHGHYVILNFWATWCGPCRVEMPLLQKYADRYPQSLSIVAINDGEATGVVQKFVDDLALNFIVLLDPTEKVIDMYQVNDFPRTYFLDMQGNIRFQHVGSLSEDQLAGYLKKLGVNQ